MDFLKRLASESFQAGAYRYIQRFANYLIDLWRPLCLQSSIIFNAITTIKNFYFCYPETGLVIDKTFSTSE